MARQRPNILLLFTDQQRADTLGVCNPVMHTPVADRLCRDGTLFVNAHTPVPVCVPARCSLIFGQYAHNTGCFENSFPMPDVTPDHPTFMAVLTAAGYRTHGVGKMHFVPNPHPVPRQAAPGGESAAVRQRPRTGSHVLMGFETRDYSEEATAKAEDDDYLSWLHQKGFDYIHDVHGVRGEMYYVPQPSPLPIWAHPSHWVADRSVEFIRTRDRSRPFFLWSSFIHPHPPFSPPVPWNKLYRAPSMPLPKRPTDMQNLWFYINHIQNRYKFRDAGIDDNLLRVMKAYYYAAVSFIDYNVGRILQALAETGDLDNTLIVWTSDHGEYLGDYDCFGKRTFLKSVANVPLIVRYPERFAAGRQVSAPASLVDIMPTLLAAAEVAAGNLALDGIDLAGLAERPGQRQMIYGQYQEGNQASYMALSERWKYIYSAADNREFLFDLLVDRDEKRNRAETLGYLDKTASMRLALISFLTHAGYTKPLDGERWRVLPSPALPRDPDAGLLFQDAPWAMPLMHIPGYSD